MMISLRVLVVIFFQIFFFFLFFWFLFCFFFWWFVRLLLLFFCFHPNFYLACFTTEVSNRLCHKQPRPTSANQLCESRAGW